MSGYDYQTERPKVFTEEGQVMFLKTRDKFKDALKTTGAIIVAKLMVDGDSWVALACIDRLVELGEARMIRTGDRTQAWVLVQ